MRKILLINRLGIGDVVLTTPLAKVLKEKLDCKIGFLAAHKARDVLLNHPYIDYVFSYRHPNKAEMLVSLKQQCFTDAVIIDGRLTSTCIAFQTCKTIRNWGFEISFGKKKIFSRRAKAVNALQDYFSYADLFTPIYLSTPGKPIIGQADESSVEKISQWIQEIKEKTKKIVLIASRGLTENKNWLPEYWGEVNVFLNQQDICPIYIGSPADHTYIDSLAGHKVNASGLFTLRELALVAKFADFGLSVCTGPMHVLASAAIPIIALYGPTSPTRWAPSNAMVIQSPLTCSPCEQLGCTYPSPYACMQQITPEMVIGKIQELGNH